MRTSADDLLLARLHAPPDLREGSEALAYWRRRRRRLPWYRVAARREATRMALAWERRVSAALIRQRGVPATARLRAVQLIAGGWLRRYVGRLALKLAVMSFVFVAAVVLMLDLLRQAL
jgi:hypothetical protein